jgi:hypothetical protein
MFAALALAGVLTSQAGPKADGLTPGAVVLLANKTDAQAAETVRAALTDPDPLVRRAAARVASVAQPDAYDALLRALPAEADRRVATEFIRDALALGGAGALPRAEPAIQRLGAGGLVPVAEWYARMQPEEFLARLTDWSRIPDAIDPLAGVVALAITRHPDVSERILAVWKPIASDKAWKRTTGVIDHVVTMRTPPGLAAQVLASTLSAARCTPHPDTIGSALVTYAASGRPTQINVNVVGLAEGCRSALSAIARFSLDEDNSGGQPQTLIVPMTPDFVSCVAQMDASPEAHPLSHGMQDPKLKKEVKPNYTHAALQRKIEGVEELDAIISSAGCVRSVEVTGKLDPDLDEQGVIAVVQWRFQPGMMEGTPVPVLICVELTFRLKR